MSGELAICDIDPELLKKLGVFKQSKSESVAAMFLKINRDTLTVELEEHYEDTSIDELRDELPNLQPRYIALSYRHEHRDGRISYPFIFIFISPQGCKPELQMMYAGTKNSIVNTGQFTKVLELRSAEDFTVEAVESCISKY